MESGPPSAAGHSYPLPAPTAGPTSGARPAGRTGPSSGASKAARGVSSANKAAKASKIKTPNGANSDHRKEQNRIASRNYREKRKHKLALLQQILDEPPASEDAGASTAATTTATPTPATGFSSLTDGLTDLPDILADILPDFQPIMSGLLPANMMAPSAGTAPTISTATSSITSSIPTITQEPQPLDESFAAWAASNLPSAVAANSTNTKNTTSTSVSASTAPSSSATTNADVLLDMPMLQPWLIPFSGDHISFSPYLPSTSLNNAAVTSPSFSSSPSSSTLTATASTNKAEAHTPSGRVVTETVNIDDAFDPTIDVDHIMSGSDSGHTNSMSAAAADANFFSDLLMRPDFSTSFYTTNSYQSLQGSIPSAPTASPMPIPTSSAPNGRRQPTRPNTTILPTRPSPRAFFQTLATPSDTTTTPVSPHVMPFRYTPPTTAAAMERDPSRRARKKNTPVVRAMLQYVQTLSPHQKRLILQALLGEEKKEGGDGHGGDDDEDERIEEIENVEDGSDGSNGGRSNISSGDSSKKKPTALLSRRDERRRQIVARWNSARRASEAAGDDLAPAFSSSMSSSPSSSGSSSAAEATGFANIALSGFDGPNGLGGPANHSSGAIGGVYGANFSAAPGARPYYPAPLTIMTLQCRRMGFRAAVLQNCLACGLDNPDVMFDEAACYEEAEELGSPFALNADEARAVVLQGAGRIAAVVAAVRQSLARSGKTPPRDLLPVDAQILVAHHPYIDVIPFRGFRARALALLAEMEAAEEVAAAVADQLTTVTSGGGAETPCLLDEDELCYDINVADGLVCWGSQMGNAGAGLSSQTKRDSESARDMRSCLPWDMRSWEPQVWFLKKYWFLVGGWDDDMWRNCRWWHSMRGDDLDYSVFASPGY